MLLNRYLFGVALIANIVLNVTSLDSKCVSDSYGILDSEHILELQVNTPPNVLDVPQVCSNYVGVTAEVCSSDEENHEVIVPNLDQVLVTSEMPVDLNLKVYCNEEPPSNQDLVKPEVVVVKVISEDVSVTDAEEDQGIQEYQEVLPVKANVVDRIAQVAKVIKKVAEIKEGANRAQGNINRVIVGAARAQHNVNKAQVGIEKAHKGIAKALDGGGKAQLRVYEAEHSILKAQKRINRAQKRINDAQKRANKAQHNVDKAKKRAEKAQKRVVKEYVRGVDYY